ncbi:mini zinc finger 2 [Perilla frutescens var. hirtella]|nr:mini zinc finger 2 [Perilla frutescens var. hirtella]KAH6817382.1 mini zinc finger 2 [Perilla frutescens var. frutescens]
MEEYYAECHKPQEKLGWNFDGCQEFKASNYDRGSCYNCSCDRSLHRKVMPKKKEVLYKKEAVYTVCHKIHRHLHNLVDGCQEFVPAVEAELTCAACGCHKSFHRNEITITQTTTSTR